MAEATGRKRNEVMLRLDDVGMEALKAAAARRGIPVAAAARELLEEKLGLRTIPPGSYGPGAEVTELDDERFLELVNRNRERLADLLGEPGRRAEVRK